MVTTRSASRGNAAPARAAPSGRRGRGRARRGHLVSTRGASSTAAAATTAPRGRGRGRPAGRGRAASRAGRRGGALRGQRGGAHVAVVVPPLTISILGPDKDMMSRQGQASVRAPPGPPASNPGSTPESSTPVNPGVETRNEGDVSDNANVSLSDFTFEPPTSRHPPNLVPRWPVTHRQRIAELQFLATFYNQKGQQENIAAAIEWHSDFPPEDFAGYESAYFQGGVVKDETELATGDGPIWYEGPPDDDMMAGHPPAVAHPGPPAATNGRTPQSSTLVARAVETTNEDEVLEFTFHPPRERNAWNLLAKWPATHRHRIKELDYMTSHYNTVGQGENIEAVKQWHASFPLDEIMGRETAYFYKGKKVKRTEVGDDAPIWVESPPHVMLMSGQGPPSSCLKNPPGPFYSGILDANFRFKPPSSRNPSDLVPRWPVTHRQRIAELKFLATFYNKEGQEANLSAAINWHSGFPPDEFCGYESACFQGGVIKDEAELGLEGEIWDEGPPDDDMMA